MIRVYHNPYYYRFQRENSLPDPQTLYLAAVVGTDRPQEAYLWTNEAAGENQEHVFWISTKRRTQWGDVLELVADGGQLLLIDPHGFQEMATSLPAQQTPFIRDLLAHLYTELMTDMGESGRLPVTAVAEIKQLRHLLKSAAQHIQLLHHTLTLALPAVDEARAGVNFSVESWTMRERRHLYGAVYQQALYVLEQLDEGLGLYEPTGPSRSRP